MKARVLHKLFNFESMNEFLYTVETPKNFEDGDIQLSSLDKANDLAFDLHLDYDYSCVRCNITGEIVAEYGEVFPLVAEGYV